MRGLAFAARVTVRVTVPARRVAVGAGLALAVGLTLAGCATAPPPTYYTLLASNDAALDTASAAVTPSPTWRIAIGPVSVPDIVDRPQLVINGSGQRVLVLDQQRWAAPLRQDIGRVLTRRLATQIPNALVTAWPAAAAGAVDERVSVERVSVDIQRFESTPGVAVLVEAVWQARRERDGKQIGGHVSRRVVPADASYDALVAAHADALNALGADIATGLITLGP